MRRHIRRVLPVVALLLWAATALAQADQKTASAPDAASKPSLPLAGYAGTYRDAWYGDIAIAQEGGRLVMRFK